MNAFFQRRSFPWFIPPLAVLCTVAVGTVCVTGCGNGGGAGTGSGGKTGGPPLNVAGPEPVLSATPKSNTPDSQQVHDFAASFMTALTSGDYATASSRLDPALKKALFPPFFDDEKTAGFSESDARKWLSQCVEGSKSFNIRTVTVLTHGASVRGEFAGTPTRRFSLRLAPGKDSLQVSRVVVTPAIAQVADTGAMSAEAMAARETAMDCLDAMCGGDVRFASTTLTLSLKRKLPSPSIPDSRDLAYAEKDVRAWLTANGKGATGYALKSAVVADKGAATIRGEFVGTASTFEMKLTATEGGEWMVEGFEISPPTKS